MFKLICRILFILIAISIAFWVVDAVQNNALLKKQVVRLHIIANSDSESDQIEKLKVKDAILDYIEEGIKNLTSHEEVESYIKSSIVDIEKRVNQILNEIGSAHSAKVTFDFEEFGKRVYDTFSLPSGIYKALKIEIGNAEGENWWCVVFPALCMTADYDQFRDVAASAGFSDGVIETISNTDGYQIRFYFLDFLGKIEKFLFKWR